MTKKEREIKRSNKRKIRFVIVTIIAIFIIFKLLSIFYSANSKTYTVKSGIVENSQSGKGIIVRDENVYYSNSDGIINYYIKDGEKIPKGIKVASIYVSNKEDIKNQVEEIEEKIRTISGDNLAKDIFSKDLNKNISVIDNTMNDLQTAINNGNYESVYKLKNDLNDNISKNNNMSGQSLYLKENVEELINKKNNLLKIMENENNNYYNLESGLFLSEVDGLENVFTFNSVLDFKLNDFTIDISGDKVDYNNLDNVLAGQPIYKICENYKWYLIAKIENKSILNLKEGKNLYIKINNDEKIKGKVVKIDKEKDDILVIFEFDSYLYKYINKRFVDLVIIKESPKGLKIPNEAITKRDNVEGVFIKNINNLIIFRPINIIEKNDKYSIIEEGDKGLIKLGDGENSKIVKSVKRYDEIIIDWSKIKESYIIN